MESHYSRKRQKKKEYLSHDLNIKQMWRLYVKECEKQGLVPIKRAKYREVFCENYSFSFFKPKKTNIHYVNVTIEQQKPVVLMMNSKRSTMITNQ